MLTTFRVGRRRVIATAAEALRRWAVQLGILPRAEGGTQRPPADRLADLINDVTCHLPLSELTAEALLSQRIRRMAALGDWNAMLVEHAAMAAAIDTLRDLHGPHWPNPLSRPAQDGVTLICPSTFTSLRERARTLGPQQMLALDIALASGARFAELDGPLASTCAGASCCLSLPRRRIQLPEELAFHFSSSLGIAAVVAELGLDENAVRLTALTRRLAAGSHLDEAFHLAGCVGSKDQAPLVPWFG